jgi:hypothetical protein
MLRLDISVEEQERHMDTRSNDPELDFIGNFAMLAGAIWLIGAGTMMIMVLLGQGRV